MKKIIIGIIVIVLIGLGVYFVKQNPSDGVDINNVEEVATTTDQTVSDQETEPKKEEQKEKSVLGKSVEGRNILAYHYGTGDTEILFVGGIHGGYSWNTALVAFELVDYLKENPTVIPENLKVTVVPVLNPDGLNKVVGSDGRFSKSDVPTVQSETVPGRFNANNVDLNRNFDCDWQAEGVWQTKKVSGGSAAFSEPESQAVKKYVENNNPKAVVVWYSSAGGVYASNCHGSVLPETLTLTNTFAKASGYKAYESFDFYTVTGDMVNWLAKNNIPAISVLLTNHSDTEWSKNQAGVEAILKHYAK